MNHKSYLFILVLAISVSDLSSFDISVFQKKILSTLPLKMAQESSSPAQATDRKAASLLVSNMHHLGNDDDDKIRLILASQSPRRREILDMLGLAGRYTATPSPLDESALQAQLIKQSLSPIEYTRRLAEKKAQALAEVLSQDESTKSTLVLGSDTIVDINEHILEKPADKESAISMLTMLSGEWHKVHTGVALYHVQGNDVRLVESFTEESRVKFAALSKRDVEAYVATNEPMDKAGSYGIQGVGGQLVERLDGDFFTVMGLPMHRTSLALAKAIAELKSS